MFITQEASPSGRAAVVGERQLGFVSHPRKGFRAATLMHLLSPSIPHSKIYFPHTITHPHPMIDPPCQEHSTHTVEAVFALISFAGKVSTLHRGLLGATLATAIYLAIHRGFAALSKDAYKSFTNV